MDNQSAEKPHPGLAKSTGEIGALALPSGSFNISLFHNELYGIALWLRDESRRWEKLGQTVPAARCALACILHCFLALEAYINTYAAWCAEVSKLPISQATLDRLLGMPTDTKWLLFPWLFSGRPVFEAGSEPFQSFADLKRVRDRFIVHPKPSVVREPTAEDCLDEGRLLITGHGHGTVPTATNRDDWPEPRCDADGAEEACKTVTRMVESLREAVTGLNHPSLPELELFQS